MRGRELSELIAFVTVAHERSFRRAAVKLGMSPSALSHTIRALEERLGARLLNRTTRSVAPTDAGKALEERLGPALAEISGAVRDVGATQQRPRGVLRVNLPRIAARLVITPVLAPFRALYPDIRLDLVIDDNLTDVVAKGFDAGIREGARLQQDMVAVRVTADTPMAVVGSPSYFATRPRPRSARDLRHHVGVMYRWSKTGAIQHWALDGAKGVDIEPAVTVNETDLLLAAALDGVGLAWLPTSYVAPHLASGALVRVLENASRTLTGFHLYYPRARRIPTPLRALVDFLKDIQP